MRLDDDNTLYATADIELKETVRVLLKEVERSGATRVVFDSLSEIRLLAGTPVRYRRQLLGFKQYFAGRDCTVVLLDDRSAEIGDLQVESLAHGVVALEQLPMAYGSDRRRLRVTKMRGVRFRSGYHDYIIDIGGLRVFPRLISAEHRHDTLIELLPSGVPELDALFGGGLDRGTATLIMGPAGTGKSVISTQHAYAAAERGERAAMFLFEERIATLEKRASALGTPLEKHVQSGNLIIQQVDPAQRAPDEFTHMVRDAVDRDGAQVVVIDSINGYFAAMPAGNFLMLQTHELLAFLAERGVATIITLAQSGLVGSMASPVDVSYLADSIVLLRYFEAAGRVRKAVSMLKKRSGPHEEFAPRADHERKNSHRRAAFELSGHLDGNTPSSRRGTGTKRCRTKRLIAIRGSTTPRGRSCSRRVVATPSSRATCSKRSEWRAASARTSTICAARSSKAPARSSSRKKRSTEERRSTWRAWSATCSTWRA